MTLYHAKIFTDKKCVEGILFLGTLSCMSCPEESEKLSLKPIITM
jgi:hypothetical protein